MIISHEHKFIFLKTKKTAGTAIEAALFWIIVGFVLAAIVGALLFLLSLVWGVHWAVVKQGLDYMPPLQYAALRLIAGSGGNRSSPPTTLTRLVPASRSSRAQSAYASWVSRTYAGVW